MLQISDNSDHDSENSDSRRVDPYMYEPVRESGSEPESGTSLADNEEQPFNTEW